MSEPKISVIMPAYNAEKYIKEAIDSILSQTFGDFEFIIIDDGSTDNTCAIIESYSDSRIRFFRNEKNMGVAATLNRGLDLARGEYIARMDSDDISMPKRFEEQVRFMDEHEDFVAIGTAYCMFGDVISEHIIECESNPQKAKSELLYCPCMAHPTVMIRKRTLDEHNLRYEEIYNGTEDYVLWWRIVSYGNIAALPSVLLKYRIHGGQITEAQSKDWRKREVFKMFAKERLDQLRINPTDEEVDVFFKYTNGKANEYTYNELLLFGIVLSKIIEENRDSHFFDQKFLKQRIGIALLECIGTTKKISFIKTLPFCIRMIPYSSMVTILKGLFLKLRQI